MTVARPGTLEAARRAVVDVGHLVRFRTSTVHRRSALPWAGVILGGLTVAACTLPMLLPGAGDSSRARDVLLLMPSAFVGFLLLAVVSGVASGGGRELLSRDQGVAFPVSPTTDHLGALLMAPLNIAWLLQAWALLGSMAYALAPGRPPPALVLTLLWVVGSTAVAQIVAWSMEALRRRPYGVVGVRMVTVGLALVGVLVQVTGRLNDLLDSLPTVWVVARAANGFGLFWLQGLAFELVLIVGAVVLGAVPAHLAARRAPRDEARVESGRFAARPLPASALGMLIRIDRASVWRAVPMRRGIAVLAIGPGLVAFAGNMTWPTMTILPGLVASGGALLFGVNSWCLDGRGLLWRESLPARPAEVFAARAYVLAEFLVGASMVTMLLAALRAGVPSSHELAALLCLEVVVTVQVVAAGLRWSAQRPFPVNLRSARATPAPPIVMVSYSARLALTTTLTGLVFSVSARMADWRISVILAVPLVLWSTWRLVRAQQRWVDPVQRSAVVMSVAA